MNPTTLDADLAALAVASPTQLREQWLGSRSWPMSKYSTASTGRLSDPASAMWTTGIEDEVMAALRVRRRVAILLECMMQPRSWP